MKKDYDQITIVLVEDDDVDAMGIQRALSNLRLLNPLIRARDGHEALDLLLGTTSETNPEGTKIQRPFILLLDLNMPRMNGLEFLAAIRGNEELKDSIVFVLTTSDSDEDRIKSYSYNIAGFIQKQQMEGQFLHVLELLQTYWRLVELPA